MTSSVRVPGLVCCNYSAGSKFINDVQVLDVHMLFGHSLSNDGLLRHDSRWKTLRNVRDDDDNESSHEVVENVLSAGDYRSNHEKYEAHQNSNSRE